MVEMKKPLEILRLYAAHDYTINGAYTSRAAGNPQREFIFHNGKSWSWQSFGEAVERTARLFVACGVNKGDRVAVMARNCDGHALALFALARIGALASVWRKVALAPPIAAPARVFIGPGEMALTRIFCGPRSLAR